MSELAEQLFEKALTAVRGRDNDRAMALLVEAIKIKPDFCEAWVVRGNVLHSIDRQFDALLHYDRALSFNDKLHDAWNNRGLAFGDLAMFGAAEECFRKSAEIVPAIEPHMGLANMYCTMMRLKDAAAEYRAALTIDGGLYDARFNLGVTLLGLGEWDEGFREYEWRWKNTPYPPRSYRNYPKWAGQDLTGKRIILYPEQGYGDEIMALRFAETVAKAFFNVYVIVQARTPMLLLAKEMQGQFGASSITVVPYSSDHDWQADYSCPLLDVPMVMGHDWKRVRSNAEESGRYLRPRSGNPLGDDSPWFDRVKALPKRLNVGLCWNSGGHLNTARAAQQAKSIPLPWLKPLDMPGVNLISLQKPKERIPPGFAITDWTDDIHDFADTAALIEELDMVVSVDTSVAHLAGALGKPTLNFVRFSGYWPWLAPDVAPTPEFSIWYPSMTLLRQPSLSNWQPAIAKAVELVAAKAQGK